MSTRVDKTASPRRRKRAALKKMVLEAGVELLERDGMGLGTETISYQRVFDHLEETVGVRVTRGSVHERIWESQRDFQLEVLSVVASWEFDTSLAATHELLTTVIAAADASTHQGRADILRLGAMLSTTDNLQRSEDDDRWLLWQAAVGSVLSLREITDEVIEVREAAANTYARLFEAWVNVYRDLIQLAGCTFNAPDGLPQEQAAEMWTSMVLALADGFAVRLAIGALEPFELATGPDGEAETWNDFSFAVWQLAQRMVNNPPD